jgi:hypothetical protein
MEAMEHELQREAVNLQHAANRHRRDEDTVTDAMIKETQVHFLVTFSNPYPA